MKITKQNLIACINAFQNLKNYQPLSWLILRNEHKIRNYKTEVEELQKQLFTEWQEGDFKQHEEKVKEQFKDDRRVLLNVMEGMFQHWLSQNEKWKEFVNEEVEVEFYTKTVSSIEEQNVPFKVDENVNERMWFEELIKQEIIIMD